MDAVEKAVSLSEKIEICTSSFEDLNVKVQTMSFSPIDSEYITMNYLLFRAGRQSKQWVHVVISLFDYDGKIIQIGESTLFELKKRNLPYVGNVFIRLEMPYDQVAKVGVYLQEC